MNESKYFICPECGSVEREIGNIKNKQSDSFEFTKQGVNTLLFCSQCDVVMEFESDYQKYSHLMGGLGA